MSPLEERANLAGKTAIVIGGAGGIGRSVSIDLARSGVDVALCDSDPDEVAGITPMLDDTGVEHLERIVDVMDADGLARCYQAFGRSFDRLDSLVNVVGGSTWLDFGETTPDIWRGDLRRNLEYVIESTHAALARIRAGGRGGSIVNFTTIEASRGRPGAARCTERPRPESRTSVAAWPSNWRPRASGSTPWRPTTRPPRAC